MEASDKLAAVWPVIKWLDDARWETAASAGGIPGPVFASLDSSGRILTHWLCYITDQQRPWENVWNEGGPVFAEVVAEYQGHAESPQDVLDCLRAFTIPNGPGHVDSFISKRQQHLKNHIKFVPRYGSHQLSIARTLALLLGYKKDIVRYLAADEDFWMAPAGDNDSSTWRLAFLLYSLSYARITQGLCSFHLQSDDFLFQLNAACNQPPPADMGALESRYRAWLPNRFYKRLWAAFRDYLKPGSYYEKLFTARLSELAGSDAAVLFLKKRLEALPWLEVPGDIWNLRFSDRLFGRAVSTPKDLREFYRALRAGGLSSEFYPEQFDVSFDFAPRMCDQIKQHLCPFKGSTRIRDCCHGSQGQSGRLCPVTNMLCGYESACRADGCPVLHGSLTDVCSGCALEIT